MRAPDGRSTRQGLRTFDPARPDFAPYGFTCERWLPRPMPRANRHNEIELNLVLGGSLTYLLGGRRVRVDAGRLAAFWAAVPHQIVTTEGDAPYFVATVPLAWFLQAGVPAAMVQRLLHGQMIAEPDDRRAALDRQLFEQWLADFEEEDPERGHVVLLELEARLLRLAHAQPRTAPRRLSRDLGSGALSKVERMATFVAQHYTERVTIATVARAVGLHPNYAMTIFRKAFGQTLIEYVTELRISHAQRLLVTTDDKVLDVALSSGFSSVSRFNDAFGRRCGCAPSVYRRTHRTAPAAAAAPVPAPTVTSS